MTLYEIAHVLGTPFLPVLGGRVRKDLRQLVARDGSPAAHLLDVGARSSPYTIGVPASITLLDIPREGEVMNKLNLGFTHELLDKVRGRRSNVVAIVLEDMTQCSLPSAHFDGVICVEVIEHIEADAAFVEQIARVLKPGGWAYFTTPNGDYIRNVPPNFNPDHVRHYRRQELHLLLSRYFSHVRVTYGVKTGKYRARGLAGPDWRRPVHTLRSMGSNVISHFQSSGLDDQHRRTAHLFAVAFKAAG